jgi:hypothetical protein
VPKTVANGLDYVLLSYYPTQCAGHEPSSLELAIELERLHSLYPHALLGFGEVGLPRRAARRTLAQAESIMRWAYSLDPVGPSSSFYIGGYFWWYGYQDVLSGNAKLATAFDAALESEASALG